MLYHPLRTHGTAVAGIIAARDNTVGVRGVAPRASIYAYNLWAETTTSTQNLAAAMTRDLNVTDISNNSWGLQHDGSPRRPSASWEAAVARGVTAGNGGDGIFYVKSGGNQHALGSESNLDGTSNFYALTTVCAIGYDDKRSAFSELGVNLWICAPGGNTTYGLPTILTTTNGSRYNFRFSGTSAATPMVSGVAALVRAANTTLTWRDVKLILANSARRNDSSNGGWQQGASKYGPSSGRYFFNREYGFGAVDAAAAVSLAANWPPLPPMREVEAESGALALAIPDAPTNGSPSVVTATLDLEPGVEFIEFIEVEVEMQHESFRDLKIEIVAPSGRVSVLAVSAGRLRWRFTRPRSTATTALARPGTWARTRPESGPCASAMCGRHWGAPSPRGSSRPMAMGSGRAFPPSLREKHWGAPSTFPGRCRTIPDPRR